MTQKKEGAQSRRSGPLHLQKITFELHRRTTHNPAWLGQLHLLFTPPGDVRDCAEMII